jgi:hypothetical protein
MISMEVMHQLKKKAAIEARSKANNLERISESSVWQENIFKALSNESKRFSGSEIVEESPDSLQQIMSLESAVSAQSDALQSGAAKKSILQNQISNSSKKITRKSSFDSVTNQQASNAKSDKSLMKKTISDVSSISSSLDLSSINKIMSLKSRGLTYSPQENNGSPTASENIAYSDGPRSNSSNSNSNAVSFQQRVNFSLANSPAGFKGAKENTSSSNGSNGIDPRQVYLQLFKQSSNEIEQTFMIPELPEIHRTQNILDYLSCFMIHRIGVVYIGSGQTLDEKSILSNTCGSPRYNNFLKGLGTFIKLKDLDTNKFYLGGLETDGSAGDFTIIWFDGITQCKFMIFLKIFYRGLFFYF